MEHSYAPHSNRRSGARRAAATRGRRAQEHEAESSRMPFEKKLAIQIAACVLIFGCIWGVRTAGGETAEWMEQEIQEALTCQIDFQTAYRSAVDVTKYLGSLLVRQQDAASVGTTDGASDAESEDPAPESGAASAPEPATGTVSETTAVPSL